MSCGATNCPFLMFTMRPVRPAATSRSVCRQRNAGICRMSADFGGGLGLRRLVDVRQHREALGLHAGQDAQPFAQAGTAIRRTLVRLALSKDALKTNGPTTRRGSRAPCGERALRFRSRTARRSATSGSPAPKQSRDELNYGTAEIGWLLVASVRPQTGACDARTRRR